MEETLNQHRENAQYKCCHQGQPCGPYLVIIIILRFIRQQASLSYHFLFIHEAESLPYHAVVLVLCEPSHLPSFVFLDRLKPPSTLSYLCYSSQESYI